ncbi:PDZ domain-containing protein [Paraburkholderia bryophila]|uniref:PDZ domain-containing protein n=1 Tax=Paraburkholderia bryophila TaxID=420952 RepID=UPI00234A78F0|nr:PDZ domain-containing protein [Paraburkholderia bryophila]WCM18256.1 PDZ domain-containing protein [Paraburkholderia bryophila]
MRLARLALLGLGGAVAGSAFAYQAPRTEVLPLSIVDNRPFITATVDAKGPFSFILDTGSSSSTVSTALAAKLKLVPTGAGTGTGAGEQQLAFSIVHLNDLSVGSLSLGALDIPTMDTSQLDRVIGFQHVDGVLGAEIFHQGVLTLDAAKGQLTLQDEHQFKPAAHAIPIPFSLDENDMPVVKASVAGIAALFQIDTGDRFSLTLFGDFWRAHRLDRQMGATIEAMTGYGGGGPIRGRVGRSASFAIGALAVPAPVTRLSLQKAGAFTRADRAGSIGMGILKRFTVSFDYGRRVMWLSKNTGFDAPDLYDRSGMWLGLSRPGPGGLQVMDVTANGPAAKAGIRAGDVVVEVGDLPAGAATLFTIRAMLQQPRRSTVPIVVSRAGGDRPVSLVLKDLIPPWQRNP